MSESSVMNPPESHFKDRARAKARDVLGGLGVFQSMSLDDQKSIYLSLVPELIDKERGKYGLSKSMATDSGSDMGYKGYDPGFQGDTRSFKELVDSVDFPKFVADLLKAVFDANLKVMKQQTDSYIKLMKEVTKSAADFLKKRRRHVCEARRIEERQIQRDHREEPGRKHQACPHKSRRGQTRLGGCRGQARHISSQDQHGQRASSGAARSAPDGRHPACRG